jgi:hypothetical protein
MQAVSYGNVYVAQVAMGANPQQTLLAMREAAKLLQSAQELIELRWETYEHMAKQEPAKFQPAS